MTNIAEEQKQEMLANLEKCRGSLKLFAKTFFPERFNLPFSKKIHDQMFEIFDDDSIQRVAIAAPRGIGKTTLTNIVIPARELLFKKRKYIIPISCTADSAVEQGENLKSELEANIDINRVFGSLKSNNWSKETWDTIYGTRVKPRGAGQQVRGRLFGRHRPDLIIIDDLEDPENMDNEEQRKKKKQWFLADVVNSINRWNNDWRIIVVGTVLHEDSLLLNLLENPNWKSLRLEICDDDFNSNWEAAITKRDVIKLYTEYRDDGEVDVFFREYRNLPIPTGEHATFSKNMFKYYDESETKLDSNPNVINLTLCDPAKTATVHSADTAIVTWGIDIIENKFHLRNVIRGKMRPNEITDNFLDEVVQFKSRVAGVETTGLEEFILFPIKNEMSRRGLFFELISLKARRGKAEYSGKGKGKEGRVAGLVDPYKRGQIYHNTTIAHLIEGQLLSFPRAKLWDVMDCAAYLIEVLEMGLVYFQSPDYNEDPYEVEKEYEELYESHDKAMTMPNWI